MAKPERAELNQSLFSYLNTVNDTLQLFEQNPPPTQEKLNWNDVLQISDHLSKQATIVGMLWTGESPKAEALKETMDSYYNALQRFLLHCHGSMLQELIRAITSMIKLENSEGNGGFVDSLEKLLKLCQGTGVEIDELGACVYTPQELSLMKQTVERIKANIGEIEADVMGFKNSSSSEALLGTCRRLHSSIERMVTKLDTRIEAE